MQFWLEQNAAALKATLQALEVQKMTMATLQTMGAAGLGAMTGGGAAAKAAAGGAKAAGGAAAFDPKEAWAAAASMPQAVEYWGALTKQFQKIAGDAMKDMGQHAATLQAHATPAISASAWLAGSRICWVIVLSGVTLCKHAMSL